MKILITGSAGFIGFHLVNSLVQEGHEIVGIDSINNYYNIALKNARLNLCGIESNSLEYGKESISSRYNNYRFVKLNLEDKVLLEEIFKKESFEIVINLAAQAGVRYSIENPDTYIQTNIVGFFNILESCRKYPVKHLVYASSSSVYGLNNNLPWSVHESVNHPISLYAATKKANEILAHSYSHLYNIPTTGLRFFTVYGPWGRPDMAPILFARNIFEGKPITVFNNGNMARDFTYIDDIIEGVCKVLNKIPKKDENWDRIKPDPATSSAPYRIFNIGNTNSVNLMEFIEAMENAAGIKAEKIYKPLQPGDVEKTHADCSDLIEEFDYKPRVSVSEGVSKFIEWFKENKNIVS